MRLWLLKIQPEWNRGIIPPLKFLGVVFVSEAGKKIFGIENKAVELEEGKDEIL